MTLDLAVISGRWNQKHRQQKGKQDTLDLTLKSSVHERTQSTRVKGQPSEWKKIFANHTSGKILTDTEDIKNSYNNKNKQPNKKWAKNLNR